MYIYVYMWALCVCWYPTWCPPCGIIQKSAFQQKKGACGKPENEQKITKKGACGKPEDEKT